MIYKLKQTPTPGICPVRGCRRPTGCRKKWCHRHHSRLWRFTHPVEAAYANLRHHAKQRGKVFALTLEQFREFVGKNSYIDDKGCTKTSLHIDRKDPSRGYEPDNIQVLTNSENSNKERRKSLVAYYRDMDPAVKVEKDPWSDPNYVGF